MDIAINYLPARGLWDPFKTEHLTQMMEKKRFKVCTERNGVVNRFLMSVYKMIPTSEQALFSEIALTSSSVQVNHVTYPDNAQTSRARLIHPQHMCLGCLYTRGVVIQALANSVAKRMYPPLLEPPCSICEMRTPRTSLKGSGEESLTWCVKGCFMPHGKVHRQCLIVGSVLRMVTTINGPGPLRVFWELQRQQSYQCPDYLGKCF